MLLLGGKHVRQGLVIMGLVRQIQVASATDNYDDKSETEETLKRRDTKSTVEKMRLRCSEANNGRRCTSSHLTVVVRIFVCCVQRRLNQTKILTRRKCFDK